MKYRCPHCGKTVKRDSSKAWIKSYCEKTGKNTRLILITGIAAATTGCTLTIAPDGTKTFSANGEDIARAIIAYEK